MFWLKLVPRSSVSGGTKSHLPDGDHDHEKIKLRRVHVIRGSFGD